MIACPFTVNLDASTITLAGATLPAVGVICPAHEEDPDKDDWQHLLMALGTRRAEVVVPCENGLLVELTWSHFEPDSPSLEVCLLARRCYLHRDMADNTPLWVAPHDGGRPGRRDPRAGRAVALEGL